MNVKLVIFDCDGVLVDSENISNQVLAEMLSEQGLHTTLARARLAYQGLRLSEVLKRAQQQLGHPLPADWLERYQSKRAERFRSELEPIAGAAEALARVSAAAVKVCVASQGALEKTRLTLGLTGLIDHFRADALFSADSVPRGKPHPDLFLHAASTMGVAPAQAVVVEDTPLGVIAGTTAGMRVLGYAADSDAQALQAAGAEILYSLEDLPSQLGISS